MKTIIVHLTCLFALFITARADVTIRPGTKPSETTKEFIKDIKKNGYPTPEPHDQTVNFNEGRSVEIELEVATSSLGSMKFTIRDAPAHGKLSEIRPHKTESNKALVTYTHTGTREELSDRFTFQAKLAEGTNTSAAGTVTLVGKPSTPHVDVIEIGQFKRMQPGEQSAQKVVVMNSGTAPFSSELKWPDPFVGPPRLDLAVNEKQTFMIMIKPPAAGAYRVDKELQPGLASSRVLAYVECIQPFGASPSALTMKFDPSTGSRAGTIKVSNGSDAPLKLRLEASARLTFDKELALEPKTTKEIDVSLDAKDVTLFHGELWIIQEPAREKIVIHAEPQPPQITLVSPKDGKIDFGKVEKGKKAEATITLQNSGGQAGILKLIALPSPFALTSTDLPLVQPGKSEQFTVTFNPLQLGDYKGTLSIGGNGGSIAIEMSGTFFDPAHPTTTASVGNPHTPPRPGAGGNTTTPKRQAASDTAAKSGPAPGPIVPESLAIPPAPTPKTEAVPAGKGLSVAPEGKQTMLGAMEKMSPAQLMLQSVVNTYGLGPETLPGQKSTILDAVPMIGVSQVGRDHLVIGWQTPKMEPKQYLLQSSRTSDVVHEGRNARMKVWEDVKNWTKTPAPPGIVGARLEGLEPGKEYELRVIGVDNEGKFSPSSDLLRVMTLPPFHFPMWGWFAIIGGLLGIVALVILRVRDQRMLAV